MSDLELTVKQTVHIQEYQPEEELDILIAQIGRVDEAHANLVGALYWGDKAIVAREAAQAIFDIAEISVRVGIPIDDVLEIVLAEKLGGPRGDDKIAKLIGKGGRL